MERSNKIKTGCSISFILSIFFVIWLIVHINSDLSKLQESFKSVNQSTHVKFKDTNQTIFFTTKEWGLGGQNSQTIISNIDHANYDIQINKENEIVFDKKCIFYYRLKEPDSLLIFTSSGSYSEEEVLYRRLGNIKVKITKYKITKEKYYKNYKKLGLSRIK